MERRRIKKRLRRSPDRADAASLAIYEPPGSNASETKPPPITTFQFGGGAGGMGLVRLPGADHVYQNVSARGSATPPVC